MFEWKVLIAPNKECKDIELRTIKDLKQSGFKIISATVPGNIECDLMRENMLSPIYYSDNIWETKRTENLHFWYYTEFELTDSDVCLHFGGIDTVSDIYINGKYVCSTDNMFIGYDVYGDFKKGRNEVIVHIKPVCIEARKYTSPAACNMQKFNYPASYVRKAVHMFGWDIMPRVVSAGIWKNVEIRKKKQDKINEVYFVTNSLDVENRTAEMNFYINIDAEEDYIFDYSVKISGKCKDSSFEVRETLWHNSFQFRFNIDNCKFWWPIRVGEQNLYDITVELYYKEILCDTYSFKSGIRTVKLNRTDYTDEKGNGEFSFEINGKKVFILGTNWVPLDALHSNDKNRLDKAMELVLDIGCNMVRCWGGNVYESEEFFDYCDKYGILVWQDFAMGCGVYPGDETFIKKIEEEAVYQIKRLRNRASLVLWAGDNEVDVFYSDAIGFKRNPNKNIINRKVLPHLVEMHDYSRPYLPSSPFISEKTYTNNLPIPEDHLWGPRDYFKGEYYSSALCHFASETGYHGFPSVKSLEKFLRNPEKLFEDEKFTVTREYLAHASCVEEGMKDPSSYRIKLAYDQVVTLFGAAEENFSDFVKQSQISQGEAKKYFIERFRLNKWNKTGIIWWNLLDGWPQVSDAVVDYYFTKKLAYNYIKRSQTPVCLMFDEPKENIIKLYAVNDLGNDKKVTYRVINISENKEVLSGEITASADASICVSDIQIKDGEKSMYLIEWETDGVIYKNHYYTNLIGIDYSRYMKEMTECGFDEFEEC